MNITTIQCRSCGAPLHVTEDAGDQIAQVTCEYCGTEQTIERNREPALLQPTEAQSTPTSAKNQLTAFLLCLFLGSFGIHRFYTGHTTYGIIQLVTLGGLGIWQLIDLVLIGLGRYHDAKGLLLHSDNPALPRGCLFGLLTFVIIFCGASFMAAALVSRASSSSSESDQPFNAVFSLAFWVAAIVGVGVVVWATRKK